MTILPASPWRNAGAGLVEGPLHPPVRPQPFGVP